MADTYHRSKYLAKLSQLQSLLNTKINPEKYWGFVEHLKDHIKIIGLDVELRKIRFIGKTYFRINLEIYFEKIPNINFEFIEKIFQLYFYEKHDVLYGQDYMFITLNEDNIPFDTSTYYTSLGTYKTLPYTKGF